MSRVQILLRSRLLIFALVLVTICFLTAALFSLFAIRQLRENYPSEPIASGNFPQTPIWIFSADTQVVATPVEHDAHILIRTEKSIYGVDVHDGSMIWRSDSPGVSPISVTPQVMKGKVFVPEEKSRIAAFDVDTGNFLWRSAEIEFGIGAPELSMIESIAVDNRCLYVARYDWTLICYALDTGDALWNVPVPNRSSLFLTVDSNRIYLSGGRFLRVYDNSTGELLWEREYGESVGPILAENGYLYVSLNNGALFAMDADSGQIIWRNFLDPDDEHLISSLTISNNNLSVASYGLYTLSKIKGNVLWENALNGYLESPVLLNNEVYIRNTDTTLFAVDQYSGIETGQLLIQHNTSLKSESHRGPAVAGERLIVPFGDNRVFAYQP